MRIESGKNFTIYCGDATSVAQDLQPMDLCVVDPPYKLEQGGCSTENGLHTRLGDGYTNDGYIVECNVEWRDIAQIIYESLKPGKHAYVMCNNRHVKEMLVEHEAAGFKFHNLLVWDKRSANPNRWYMKNLEFIGFFYKERSFPINNCSSKQLVCMPQVDESNHPTEKPVLLMEHYIRNSSKEGEIVFDPFAGSGTTGVAAIKSGRYFIGIEKDEKYFEMMLGRLRKQEEAAPQWSLF